MNVTDDEYEKNRSAKNILADATAPQNPLLNKDWGAKVPDYVSQTGVFLLIFIMGATIRGEWLLYLAFYWRWQDDSSGSLDSSGIKDDLLNNKTNSTDNYLADLMVQRLHNFWPIFIVSTAVGYLFFFGIGGYLQVKYYIGMKDRPEEWKCQPNHWLPPHLERHEIIVGLFSLTLGR